MREDKIKRIIEMLISKQFITFVIIGGVNTLSSAIFSSLYARILDGVSAFFPGYLTGVIVSYILNTIITFKETFGITKFIKFTISTIPNFIIQTVVVYIGIQIIKIPNLVAYGIAAIIGVPITFLILKLYVFIKRDN